MTNTDGVQRPPLRLGVIGLGRAFFFEHLPALKTLGELFRIVAVCDLLKERRDQVEKDIPDLRTYRRIDDMLDDADIDVILVALPTIEHFSVTLNSLRHNKPTIVESPPSTSLDEIKTLRVATDFRTRNNLFVYTPGVFAPDFKLAMTALADPRLGEVFEVRICHQDYIRRNDWQTIRRCRGGYLWHSGPDAILEALTLLRTRPAQLWSETKRIASLGDAEDLVRIMLKTRTAITADIEICGAQLPPFSPSFTVRGSRGTFSVASGAADGMLHVIDPEFKLPRRRSSVRTPPLVDLHEDLPIVDIPLSLPDTSVCGALAFWRAVHASICTAAPFPVPMDDIMDTIRYLQLIDKLNLKNKE